MTKDELKSAMEAERRPVWILVFAGEPLHPGCNEVSP